MGWTSYNARFYKNGVIDRKAECDYYFMNGMNRGMYRVEKSCMVGSTYYAAVTVMKKCISWEEEKFEDIPENERKTIGVVFLTSVDMKRHDNFFYKDISEDMGPIQCKCPESILKLLSPTDSEWANEWRKKCHQYNLSKRDPMALSNLPIGSIIEYTIEDGETIRLEKHKPAYQFKRSFWYYTETGTYVSRKRIPDNYKVISIPA